MIGNWRWACPMAVLMVGLAAPVAQPGRLAARDGGDDEAIDIEELEAALLHGRYAKVIGLAAEIDGAAEAPVSQRLRAAALAASALRATGRYDDALARASTAMEAGSSAEGPAQHPKLLAALALQIGETCRMVGRLADSEQAFRRALELDPTSARSRLLLAQLLLEDQGRRADASPLLLELLDLYQNADSLSATELLCCGQACLSLDLFPEIKNEYSRPMYLYAQRMFDEAIEADDRHVDTFTAYGWIFFDKLNFPSAKKAFKKALAINPDHVEARTGLAEATLAEVYGGSGRFEEANRELARALKINSRHPASRALEAFIHFTDDEFDLALQVTAAVLEVNPHHLRSRAIRAAVFFCRGDETGFESERVEVFAVNPAPADFFVQVARLIVIKFRYRGAADMARRAIELDPEWWPAYTELGLNLGRTGDEEAAYHYLEKAFENDPFNVFAKNQLSVLDRIRDEYDTRLSEHFTLRMHGQEMPVIGDAYMALLEQARAELCSKYSVDLPRPVLVEVFPNIQDFSARTIGLPLIGALGACFGDVVTLISPAERRVGSHNWGRTLWHEFTHVVTLKRSKQRVPRWFTEGLSVYEEDRGRPGWGRGESDAMLLRALRQGQILPMARLNAGFTKPQGPAQIMLAYTQGGAVCEFIAEQWGFSNLVSMLDAFAEGLDTAAVIDRVLEVDLETFDSGFESFLLDRYSGWSYRAPSTREQLRDWLKQARERRSDGASASRVALACIDHRKWADADIWSSRALAADPENGDARLVRALLALRKKNLDRARNLLEEALDRGTSDPVTARRRLAMIAARKGDAPTAVRHLLEARDLFPRDLDIYRRLIRAAQAAGDDGVVRSSREALCALDPTEVPARLELAREYHTEQAHGDLRRVAEDVLFVNPFGPEAHFYLAWSMEELGEDLSVAEREYGIALDLGHTSRGECQLGMARCALAQGRRDHAASVLRQLLRADPGNAEARELLKRAESGGEKPEEEDGR